MIIIYLTCVDDEEAHKISVALLEARLIACAKKSVINSSYWWEGKINHNNETLIMMETNEEKYDDIEKVVASLHSYDEFVLTAVPVLKFNSGVQEWLDDNLTS